MHGLSILLPLIYMSNLMSVHSLYILVRSPERQGHGSKGGEVEVTLAYPSQRASWGSCAFYPHNSGRLWVIPLGSGNLGEGTKIQAP